jgi:hypothetical protein
MTPAQISEAGRMAHEWVNNVEVKKYGRRSQEIQVFDLELMIGDFMPQQNDEFILPQ